MPRYLHYTPGAVPQVAGYNLAQAQAPAQVEGQGAKILNAALGAGREALGIVARDYNRYQTCRVSDLVESTDRRFEEWKANWTRENQGVNATDAQKIFAGKYEELSNEALEEFGGSEHEIYRHELEKKLLARGLMAFRDGGRYQQQQTELWEKSVWDGKLAELKRAVDDNPEDRDRAQYLLNEALEYRASMRPGQDISAERLALEDLVNEGRIDSLLNRGEVDAANNVLGSMQQGGKAIIRGMAPETETLIRNAARKYGIDEELALATAMQESGGNQKCVSHAGATGVMQLMPGTARDLGVNPHDIAQNIDGGVRYLAAMKKKFGNDQDALTAYNWGPGAMQKYIAGGRKGAMPKEAREYAGRVMGRRQGVSSAKYAQAKAKIDAYAKKQEAEAQKAQQLALLNSLEGIAAEAAKLPEEAQADYIYRGVEQLGIKDPKALAEARSHASSQIEYLKKRHKASEARSIGEICELGKMDNPTQFAARLLESGLSPEARKQAEEKHNGKLVENELNMRALAKLREDIDRAQENGSPLTEDDIYSRAYDSRMTNEQLKSALKYLAEGGNRGSLKFTEVRQIWTSLQSMQGEKVKPDDMPSWMYDAVLKQLPQGKEPSYNLIKQLVARACISGKVPGRIWGKSSTTYGKALAEGKQDVFTAD